MKYWHLALGILIPLSLGACASHQAKTDNKSRSAPAAKSSPATRAPTNREATSAKESAAANNGIVGKPLPGGKFAKLKIGMPVKQVEELIGSPNEQWQQTVGEATTPYYSGPDAWVLQYSYKSEGMLTFSSSQEKLLIRILVNRAE